jgi:hypothetical protein
MQRYEAVLTDLYRSGAEYREERVLFRLPSAEGSAKSCGADNDEGARVVADLLRFAPGESGMYRASTPISVESAVATLEQKLLTPRLGIAPPSKQAPNVVVGDGAVGSESDLETRIDAPPAARTGVLPGNEMLRAVLTKANVRAMLQLHRSEVAPDAVFVKLRSTIVLSAGSDWDDNAVRNALQKSVAPGLTTSGLGAGWKQAGNGAEAHYELDGLAELLVAVRGKYLFVGNDLAMLNGALRRMSEPVAAEPACYAAGFSHGRQRQDFYRLSSLVDQPNRPGGSAGSTHEPDFFSGNVASLSQVLAGVESQTIVIRSAGAQEMQSVRYRWSR